MKTTIIFFLSLFAFNHKANSQALITSNETFLSDEFPKSFYRDGKSFQWIVNNGISVTIHVAFEKNYGKHYTFYISIENLSGAPIDFNPEEIEVELENNIKSQVKLINGDEYLKKIKKKQKIEASLNNFFQSLAANNAAYSTSTSTVTSNFYGPSSNYYSKRRITTTTYDGNNAYIANQIAQQNRKQQENSNFQIRKNLFNIYLKRHTIFNEENLNGVVKVDYYPARYIHVKIPINGILYNFAIKRSMVHLPQV